MSKAILDLDPTQLLEKNKAINTDSLSVPSLETDILENIDLSISANSFNNSLLPGISNQNESLVKANTVTNTDITLASNLGSDKFESNSISTLANPSNNFLISGISNETDSLINNKFEQIGEQAFFGNTSGLFTYSAETSLASTPQDLIADSNIGAARAPLPLGRINFQIAQRSQNITGFGQTVVGIRIAPNQGVDSGTFAASLLLRATKQVVRPDGTTFLEDIRDSAPIVVSGYIQPHIVIPPLVNTVPPFQFSEPVTGTYNTVDIISGTVVGLSGPQVPFPPRTFPTRPEKDIPLQVI